VADGPVSGGDWLDAIDGPVSGGLVDVVDGPVSGGLDRCG
jgi:hypothetical protein